MSLSSSVRSHTVLPSLRAPNLNGRQLNLPADFKGDLPHEDTIYLLLLLDRAGAVVWRGGAKARRNPTRRLRLLLP